MPVASGRLWFEVMRFGNVASGNGNNRDEGGFSSQALGCFLVAAVASVYMPCAAASTAQNAPVSKSRGASAPAETGPSRQSHPADATPQRFYIDEIRVDGADKLPQIELEEAIYPFVGPNRTADDVEKARAALEKKYHDRGYQTVNVSVPSQNVAGGTVVLKVMEAKVGRLRVKNSRFFDTEKIREKAPSLEEGALPNFNEVTKDIVALNQWPDRRVTPALRAGVTPGTVDVDLNVEDKFPLHASVEYNNRQSPNTTPTRLNATVKYENLWQLGHSLSLTYQVAPELRSDAEVYSGSYLARLTDWTSILVYGVSSKSDVATVGGMNIVGPGQIVGGRFVMTLPARDDFFHSLSFGADYKNFGQTVQLGVDSFESPITYYPLNATYGATWQNEGALTQFNLALTVNLRGPGSGFEEWVARRFNASANFFHVNAELSHTQDLPEKFQIFGRVKTQWADSPLVSSEQFSLGGVETVRGYLESVTIGDYGVAGTVELRSPDVGSWLQSQMKDETAQGPARFITFNEWRLFGFVDAGTARINDPMLDQQSRFNLWSYGVGTRFKLFNHFNGMIAYAVPMVTQGDSRKNDHRVLFNARGEF